MKKRCGVLALAWVAALMLSACSPDGEASAYEQYLDGYEKLQTAAALTTVRNMNMSIEAGGAAMNVDMLMDAGIMIKSDAEIEVEMDIVMSMLGQAANGKVYYKDGYLYTNMMGMRTKQKKTAAEILSEASAVPVDFPEGAIIEQTINSLSDGEKELVFVLDGSKLADIFSGQFGGFAASLSDDGNIFSMGDSVTLKAVLNKTGEVSREDLRFTAEITIMGETANAVMAIENKIARSEDIQIAFPVDLEMYAEVLAG